MAEGRGMPDTKHPDSTSSGCGDFPLPPSLRNVQKNPIFFVCLLGPHKPWVQQADVSPTDCLVAPVYTHALLTRGRTEAGSGTDRAGA